MDKAAQDAVNTTLVMKGGNPGEKFIIYCPSTESGKNYGMVCYHDRWIRFILFEI